MVLAHDPNATIEYTIDWEPYLPAGVTIVESEDSPQWIVTPETEEELDPEGQAVTDTTASVTIPNLEKGTRYRVECRVTGSDAKRYVGSFYLRGVLQ